MLLNPRQLRNLAARDRQRSEYRVGERTADSRSESPPPFEKTGGEDCYSQTPAEGITSERQRSSAFCSFGSTGMREMRTKEAELASLREKCMVMKNLLRDISENEYSLNGLPGGTTSEEIENAVQARANMRKALVSEIDNLLLRESPTRQLIV